MWDVTFAGFGRCRLEIETGGIAIDLLHGLVHVQKRFREKAKKRENGQMCSLQLIGAEALVLDLISFSEAASLSPPTPCNYAEALFNSLHLTKTFFFLNFKPVLAECSHYFNWFSQIFFESFWLNLGEIFFSSFLISSLVNSLFDPWKLWASSRCFITVGSLCLRVFRSPLVRQNFWVPPFLLIY